MSYVLVSLVGDAATEESDKFARWLAGEIRPARAFHDEHPEHAAVAAAVKVTPVALVICHDGGGSVRARRDGPSWADAASFATIFSDARVWAYACNTRAPKLAEDLESFGRRAFASGVRVFAGHCSSIIAPPDAPTYPALRRAGYRALGRAMRAFLRGENRADELRRIALREAAASGRRAVFAAPAIEDAMNSLRVLA